MSLVIHWVRFLKTYIKVHKHSRGDETQKAINFGDKFNFILSFFFLNASTLVRYIFTALNYTTTIINLETRALNVEFQDFILNFLKIFLLYESTFFLLVKNR